MIVGIFLNYYVPQQSHQHHRHRAVVLTKLSLDPLLDQEFEGRHRAERVQNLEVP